MANEPSTLLALNKRKIRYRKTKFLLRQRLAGHMCFIHINKCGGTSIERALEIPKIHDTAEQRRKAVGKRRWDRMFKFSFVRNPFDRVCSHYRYRIKTNQIGIHHSQLDINDWIKRAYGDKDPRYYDQPLYFSPCCHWITDHNGNFIVDFIGKLETISSDWEIIKRECGIRADLPNRNTTITSLEEVSSLDATSKEIIRWHFCEDFNAFGYSKDR